MSIIEKPIEEETVEVPDVLPEVDPVTQVLIEAKAYLMEHGWCQHTEVDDRGRVCMVGALGKVEAYRVGDNNDTATQRLIRIVGPYVTTWNDSTERTVEEVYEAFDRAIAYKE